MSKIADFKNLKNVCYAFMFSGIVITLITISIAISSGYNNSLLIGTISGYTTVTVGLIGLMALFMMGVNFQGGDTVATIYDNIAIIVQFLIIIVILIYSFFMNGAYFTKISENNINDSYKWFSFISILLLFVQFIILSNLINSIYYSVKPAMKTYINKNVQIIFSLIVAIINMTTLLTASQSLVFFSTDG